MSVIFKGMDYDCAVIAGVVVACDGAVVVVRGKKGVWSSGTVIWLGVFEFSVY